PAVVHTIESLLGLLIAISVPAFAIASMLSMGLRTPLRAFRSQLRDRRTVLSVLGANFVVVPAVGTLLVWLLNGLLPQPTGDGFVIARPRSRPPAGAAADRPAAPADGGGFRHRPVRRRGPLRAPARRDGPHPLRRDRRTDGRAAARLDRVHAARGAFPAAGRGRARLVGGAAAAGNDALADDRGHRHRRRVAGLGRSARPRRGRRRRGLRRADVPL